MSEPTTTIDDLLRHDEEPEPTTGRKGTAIGWLLRSALAAGAMTAVAIVGLRLFGLDVSGVGVFAGFAALLLIRRVSIRLAPASASRPARRPAPRGADRFDQSGGQDALLAAVRQWEQRLTGWEADRQAFGWTVPPSLGELADERLRQRHGLTREADPARARKLLGEPLWTWLACPPNRRPTAGEYAAIVSRLESL